MAELEINKDAISIVIPVHNEGKCIQELLQGIVMQLKTNGIQNYEIIIVENGSTDNTVAILQTFQKHNEKLRVISMDRADYGGAIRKGMLLASGSYIINFDLDYADVDFIKNNLPLLTEYDTIVASKNMRLSEDQRPWFRRFITMIYRLVLFALFGLKCSDTHGIKVWKNTDRLRGLISQTKSNGNIFDSELIIRAEKAGFRIYEVPVRVKEIRPSTTSIVKRIPLTLIKLVKLWYYINFSEKKVSVTKNSCGKRPEATFYRILIIFMICRA